MKGELGFSSLEALLRTLNTEHRTGNLRIAHPRAEGGIWLQDGEPVHAEFGSLRGTAALNALLADQQGDYEFSDGAAPLRRSVDSPLDRLLDDAMLQTSERPGLQESYVGQTVPSLSIDADSDGELRLTPQEIELLRCVDGRRTVAEIAALAGIDEHSIPALFRRLRQNGIIEMASRRPRTARLVARLGGRTLGMDEAGVDGGIVRSWSRALGRAPERVACRTRDGRTFVLGLKTVDNA
ncbi:MAG TPA: DUF4388 domain-containing protein, partial [Deinococcales bacterium]|nr:DUF4388 domain-containing protein [Deinococcales bacterium]